MAKWMLAEDLLTRPGEHPEQVEAARKHLMGGFEDYEKVDLTPTWAQQAQREDVTGKEKLLAAGVPEERIVECKDRRIDRIEDDGGSFFGTEDEQIAFWTKVLANRKTIMDEGTSAEITIDRPTVSSSQDEIERPAHYTKGIETIDYIESWEMDFRAANVIKYVTRAPHKGKPLSDLKKARWYINRMIAELEDKL